MTFRLFLIIKLALCVSAPAFAQPMQFTHPPPEASSDQRHSYYWELLDAALRANQDRYGPYQLNAHDKPMSFERAVAEVESGRGLVNIVSRAPNRELERRLLPIRLPLDKGLLGTRLFLSMPSTQSRLDAVRTLDNLRAFTLGQQRSWSDVPILQAAGFRLILADSYPPMFAMLGAGRFDLFPRGVIEIAAEWRANRGAVPGLQIEPRLVLKYPMPRYFFVPRTAEGERLAERIADGLRRLQASGEFERRYRAFKALVLRDLNLAGRTVLRIPNPQLDPAVPLTDRAWWDSLDAEFAAPKSR